MSAVLTAVRMFLLLVSCNERYKLPSPWSPSFCAPSSWYQKQFLLRVHQWAFAALTRPRSSQDNLCFKEPSTALLSATQPSNVWLRLRLPLKVNFYAYVHPCYHFAVVPHSVATSGQVFKISSLNVHTVRLHFRSFRRHFFLHSDLRIWSFMPACPSALLAVQVTTIRGACERLTVISRAVSDHHQTPRPAASHIICRLQSRKTVQSIGLLHQFWKSYLKDSLAASAKRDCS